MYLLGQIVVRIRMLKLLHIKSLHILKSYSDSNGVDKFSS